MLKYSLAFLAGNIFLQQQSRLDLSLLLNFFYLALMLLSLGFILGYFICSCHYKKRLVQVSFLAVFFFSALFLSYFNAKQSIDQVFPQQLENKEIIVQGYIDSIPSENKRNLKFNFRVTNVIQPENSYSQQVVRLSWYKNNRKNFSKQFLKQMKVLKVADYWQFKVKLKRPSGLLNPAGRDYEKWLFAHQIKAVGYIRKGSENKLISDNLSSYPLSIVQQLLYSLHQLRQNLAHQLKQLLNDNEFKGIYLALALGIKDQISALQWQVFLDSGTNHLIAISGLHIGLFSSLGFLIGLRLWSLSETLLKQYPAQLAGAVLALIFAFVYAALAGFSIPTQRALIMISLALSGVLLRMYIPPSLILSMALILVLLIDPMASLSIGFWLSFAAVASILFFLSTTHQKDKPEQAFELVGETKIPIRKKILAAAQLMGQLTKMQLVIFIGLLPLSLLFFSRLLLLSPLANLIAVPLMSLLIVPFVLLAALLMLFYLPLASFIFSLINYPMQLLWWFLSWLSHIDMNILQIGYRHIFFISLAFIIASFYWLFKQHKKRYYIFSLFIAVLIACLFISQEGENNLIDNFREQSKYGDFKLSVLDVGQGLSVLLETKSHVLIYDTGNALSDNFDMAKLAIIPVLRYKGISQLDQLILSHGDHDHIGSAPSLLAQYAVDNILTGEPDRLMKKFSITAKQCQQGQKWSWDGVIFEILFPHGKYVTASNKSNNRSCVLLVTSAMGKKLLLTGDIEKRVEPQLIGLAKTQNIDILVAPHHGSKSSSSKDFVAWLNPKQVIFSNGYLNRYHFPAKKIVQRYQQQGSSMFSTANGMIEIKTINSTKPMVFEYRKDSRHYWNRAYQKLRM